jgi:hypothetical protein
MNLNFLFGYQNNTAATSANNAGNIFQATGPPADMSLFKAGQTIQGEVVAARNNEIILQLEDGSQISAKLTKDININVGQTMTFEVKSNSGSRLSLSPLFENMGHDPNALKALQAAGLPVSARNIDMVSLLMRQGMPVDKNALLHFSRQMAMNPATNPVTLAQMNRLEIPASPENIRQFEAYKNYEHQISSAVREITDGLVRDISQMAVKGETDGAVALFKQVLNIFGSGPAENAASQGSQNASLADGQANPAGSNTQMITSDDILKMIGEPAKNDAPASLNQDASIKQDMNPDGSIKSDVSMKADAFMLNQKSGAAKIADSAEMPENLALARQNAVHAAGPETLAAISPETDGTQAPVLPQTISSEQVFLSLLDLTPENRGQLADLLREAGFPSGLTDAVNNANISQQTLISLLNQALTQNPERIDNEKLAALFSNKDFQAVIKNDINNQWLVKPEDVSKEKFVEAHFKKIFEQTNRLAETLNSAGRGESAVAQSASQLSNNINFINQLNQVFTYIQLPLKMSEGNTHGELFIYTNKKNLAKNDGNVSALLHLDMEYLGPLDIHIAMQNKKVANKYYLANDQVIGLLAKHIHVLNDRLRERGYAVNSEFVARIADKRPIDEIVEATKNVSVLASYSFDARA